MKSIDYNVAMTFILNNNKNNNNNNGPLLCGFNVAIKGLTYLRRSAQRHLIDETSCVRA